MQERASGYQAAGEISIQLEKLRAKPLYLFCRWQEGLPTFNFGGIL
jgi:hypothetical protein